MAAVIVAAAPRLPTIEAYNQLPPGPAEAKGDPPSRAASSPSSPLGASGLRGRVSRLIVLLETLFVGVDT
jgi:hypothetical protein